MKLEWTNAISLEKAIIPCQLGTAKLPAILAHKAYVDFRNVDHGIAHLLQALNLARQKTMPAPTNNPTEQVARVIHSQLTESSAPARPKPPQIVLRSKPLNELSWAEVANEMLQEKDFFDARWHKLGNSLRNKYEKIERNGHKIVIDHTTGLTWQQTGSLKSYVNIEKYIRGLNQQNFGGHKTWRLPTLEEAMSLIKPQKNHYELYIDPAFDQKQKRIWTADKEDEISAWVVYFDEGTCARTRIDHTLFVRAVCDGQSII